MAASLSPTALTDRDIDLRLPAWCALSELFVDMELDDLRIAWIARSLSATPFDANALDIILRREVAPFFIGNIFAWNWTGWSPENVKEMMLGHLQRRAAWPARLAAPLLALVDKWAMSSFEEPWLQVRQEMARVAGEAAAAQARAQSK